MSVYVVMQKCITEGRLCGGLWLSKIASAAVISPWSFGNRGLGDVRNGYLFGRAAGCDA